MDMSQVIKTVINCARELEKQNSLYSVIQQLQILSTTDDLSVFDTTSFETAEFFTILYDLLTQHSSNGELIWCIISVLQVVVHNPNASSALVHSYHFIIPLTTILENQMTSERTQVVLKIIQELTYGVVICWQEAHLPKLIRMLLDFIMNNETELIPVALGVMVNLCHKNKPAVYTLMNHIDMKTFLRTILNLRRDNVETSVQVCKLLMILNHLSGNVPDTEILSFVRVSFMRINQAFRCGNTSLMRHIVDFFRDAKESEQGKKVLQTYPKYEEETDNLINELCKKTVPNSWQCVHQLLEFTQQLVDLEQSALLPLFPRLTQSLLPWIQVGGVARTALELLTTMLCQSRSQDTDVYGALITCIEDQLQMFIEMLHKDCKSKPTASEDQDTLTSLFHFLNELVANPHLITQIAIAVDKEEIKNLLLPLTSARNDDTSQLFEQSVTALYVEVLSFVSNLSMDDTEWLFLYSDLLQKRQILKALAVALYFGSCDVKKQILFLAGTSSFSKESLNVLSKCLSDLNQLFLFSPNSTKHNPEKCVSYPPAQMDCSSFFTKTHKEHLDSLIEKLDNLYKSNQIQDSSLSGIIELYNYKLGEMRRAEHSLQSSLEAADTHRAHLTHRVSLLSGETNRMHQLLYASQQSLEGTQSEVTQLRERLQEAQQAATESHTKFRQFKQDVQSKSITIKEQTEELMKINQSLEEFKNKCKHLEETNSTLNQKNEEQSKLIDKFEQRTACLTEKVEEQSKLIEKLDQKSLDLEEKVSDLNRISQKLEKEKADLQLAVTKLEGKVTIRDKSILEKEVSIEDKTRLVMKLEQELINQQGLIKGLEKNIKDKEKEITAQKTQLVELEKMRKVIFDITGGKKNF